MAEKLEMMSEDIIQDNIEYIASKFPNALKETKDDNGKLVKKIDFDVLKQELSNVVIDDKKERYQMTWPDKKKSILLANSRINGTLRPAKEKSIDFDNTQNLYIEGDNLDVLKLLRETYLGKVKMIYIDPPYNTGNDFVYNDDFAQSSDEYLNNSGQFDEQGNRMVTNSESNGRFHTDWLNMMYPRLKVARDLLTDDGVIFISIDDNEVDNLRKICDEIFGRQNFVSILVWQKNFAPKNDNKYISVSTEYILLYAKSINNFNRGLLPREEKHNKGYSNPDNDSRGVWTSGSMLATTYSNSGVFEIISPNGKVNLPPAGRCWRYSQATIKKLKEDNRIWWGSDGNGVPRVKRFLSEMPDGIVPQNLMLYTEVGSNQDGNLEMKDLFDAQIFDYPKCTKLMERLVIIADLKPNDLILDFFSGSATMAHEVMKYNSYTRKNIRYIMIQIPENYVDKSNVYNFKTICDIGEERIRRAGKKIKDELIEKKNTAGLLADDIIDPDLLDIGFRVLKLDSSNMNDVYYNPNAMTQSLLDETVDNIKSDRTAIDLLFQVMLELGIELSAKISEKEINSKKYFQVNENDIVACFDDSLDNDLLTVIAKLQPLYAVFKDSSFATDSICINNEQIFKTYSPRTKIKVL